MSRSREISSASISALRISASRLQLRLAGEKSLFGVSQCPGAAYSNGDSRRASDSMNLT